MFGFRHWTVSFGLALVLNLSIVAFATYFQVEADKVERAAGPTLSVIGAADLFAETDSDDGNNVEDVEEVTSPETQSVKAEPDAVPEVDNVEPTETPTDFEPTTVETPLETVTEAPTEESLAILPTKTKEQKAEPVKKKKPKAKPVKKKKPKKKVVEKKKKKKKVTKNKRKKQVKKKKGGKRTAATKKGGGSKGKQRKVSGKASMSSYKGRVRARVARNRRKVGSSRGTVVVNFSVTASGAAVGIRLARRSGNAALDRAALSAVRRASPFPRIPAGLPRRMNFSIPFHFR